MASIEDSLRRVPPQSLDAEQSVLGGVLLDNTALDRAGRDAAGRTTSTARRTARSSAACSRLSERSEPVDLITLSEELRGARRAGRRRRRRLPGRAGGARADRRQHPAVRPHRARQGDPAQPDHHRHGDRRARLRGGQRRRRSCSSGRSRRSSPSPTARCGRRSSASTACCDAAFKTIEQLCTSSAAAVTGVPTGFADLDTLTAGLQPSDLIIVGGRPSMGKTAFCLNIARARRAAGRERRRRLLARDVEGAARHAHAVLRGARRPVEGPHRPPERPRVPRAGGGGRPPVGRADLHRRHAGPVGARAARQGAPAAARPGGQARS